MPSRSRCNTDHEGDVEEIEQNATDGTPEEVNISTTYALAEEDAVMIHIFDAHPTVLAMLRLVIRLNLAVIAPDMATLNW